jgi:hypothetical protein
MSVNIEADDMKVVFEHWDESVEAPGPEQQ